MTLKVIPKFIKAKKSLGAISIPEKDIFVHIILTLPNTVIKQGDSFFSYHSIMYCILNRLEYTDEKVLCVSKDYYNYCSPETLCRVPSISKESTQKLVDHYNKYDMLPNEVEISYSSTKERDHVCVLNEEGTVDILTAY